MRVPYIYIASPYWHEDKAIRLRRVESVQLYCSVMFHRNVAAYSPIAHWAPIAELAGLPHGIDKFWKQDEAMLYNSAAMHVLRLDGWEQSVGVKTEIDYAKDNGKPIVYVDFVLQT